MNGRRSKTSLFLIELLIAILFFSLVAAVGVRLFAISHVMANESKELNFAVSKSASVAEVFECCDGDVEKIANLLGGQYNESAVVLLYDEDWNLQNEITRASYRLKINVSSKSNLNEADIDVIKIGDGREIYSLHVGKYLPQKISVKEEVAK